MPGAQDDFFQSGNDATAISGIQAFVEGLMRLEMKLPILKTLQVLSAIQRSQAAVQLLIAFWASLSRTGIACSCHACCQPLADSKHALLCKLPCRFWRGPLTPLVVMLCKFGVVLHSSVA